MMRVMSRFSLPVSIARFSRRTLSKPDSRATAVLIDELDTGGFQSASNYVERCASWLAKPRFQLMHCDNSHRSLGGEILLAPIKERTGCSALF